MRRISREFILGVSASLGVHVLWFCTEAEAARSVPIAPTEVRLDVDVPAPPPAPEAPPPKPAEPDKASTPTAAERRLAPTARPAAPAKSAAQAAKTLTAPASASSDNAADFTLVQGTGDMYVGGTTSALGTSTTAVRGPVVPPVQPPARLPVARRADPGPNMSRPPRPLGSDWNCSRLFPSHQDAGNAASVSIAVTVSVDGKPLTVAVLRDPGHGFGEAARACALGQKYAPGLDASGRPVVSTTPPIRVHFVR